MKDSSWFTSDNCCKKVLVLLLIVIIESGLEFWGAWVIFQCWNSHHKLNVEEIQKMDNSSTVFSKDNYSALSPSITFLFQLGQIISAEQPNHMFIHFPNKLAERLHNLFIFYSSIWNWRKKTLLYTRNCFPLKGISLNNIIMQSQTICLHQTGNLICDVIF